MALISRIGTSLGRRAAVGAGLAAVGVLGAAKGFREESGDLNDAFYEVTTGNPNIDEDVFGMPMSPGSLLLPTPRMSLPDSVRNVHMAGLNIGQMTGAVMTRDGRRRLRLMTQPQILGRTQAYKNRMPQVNGSVVHGLYNGR